MCVPGPQVKCCPGSGWTALPSRLTDVEESWFHLCNAAVPLVPEHSHFEMLHRVQSLVWTMRITLLMLAVAVVAAAISVVLFFFIVVVVQIKAEQDSSICKKVHVKKRDVLMFKGCCTKHYILHPSFSYVFKLSMKVLNSRLMKVTHCKKKNCCSRKSHNTAQYRV